MVVEKPEVPSPSTTGSADTKVYEPIVVIRRGAPATPAASSTGLASVSAATPDGGAGTGPLGGAPVPVPVPAGGPVGQVGAGVRGLGAGARWARGGRGGVGLFPAWLSHHPAIADPH